MESARSLNSNDSQTTVKRTFNYVGSKKKESKIISRILKPEKDTSPMSKT